VNTKAPLYCDEARPPTHWQPRDWSGPLTSRAELDKLTTPQRIDLIEQRRAERIGQMNQRMDATKAFYAQLTPEQQRLFDAQMPLSVPAQ